MITEERNVYTWRKSLQKQTQKNPEHPKQSRNCETEVERVRSRAHKMAQGLAWGPEFNPGSHMVEGENRPHRLSSDLTREPWVLHTNTQQWGLIIIPEQGHDVEEYGRNTIYQDNSCVLVMFLSLGQNTWEKRQLKGRNFPLKESKKPDTVAQFWNSSTRGWM